MKPACLKASCDADLHAIVKGPVYTEHQRQCCDVANSIALTKYLRFLNKLNQFIAARK